MAKPTHLDWEGTNGVIEPSAGKKGTGWASAEKPAFQYMNWIHSISDQWHKYLDAFTLADGAYNVGINLSGGTAKLVQADGNDFSDEDGERGFIVMESQATPGKKQILTITEATHLFVDDSGASDIIGEEFGTTTLVAWANARPFWIYAVNRNDTDAGLKFAISPDPRATASPATANIGYHANPAATPSDRNFFFLTETNVTATHNEKPCLNIGGITMTKTALDDWTVATLSFASGHGIRNDALFGKKFTMPLAQMGAATGTYIQDNAGFAPVFTTNEYGYALSKEGMCSIEFYLNGDGGTDGGGAVQSRLVLPYKPSMIGSNPIGTIHVGSGIAQTTMTTDSLVGANLDTDNTFLPLVYLNGSSVWAAIDNGFWTSGARSLSGKVEFCAFS